MYVSPYLLTKCNSAFYSQKKKTAILLDPRWKTRYNTDIINVFKKKKKSKLNESIFHTVIYIKTRYKWYNIKPFLLSLLPSSSVSPLSVDRFLQKRFWLALYLRRNIRLPKEKIKRKRKYETQKRQGCVCQVQTSFFSYLHSFLFPCVPSLSVVCNEAFPNIC